MIFLKSLIFLLYNLLAGFLIVATIRTLLLFPKKKIYLGNRKVPLTPGILYKYRNLLIKKLKDTLNNYINDSRDENSSSKISVWENRIFRNVWDKLESIENIRFLPKSFKSNVRYIIALLAYEITKQFLRTFIPFLLEKFKAHKLITIIEEKLDMKIISEYYDKYIFKFMLIFFLSINFIIGLGNMIIYLIIH